LVHANDPHATIEVTVDERQAFIEWLSAHEHLDVGDDSTERSWTTQLVDAVAALLPGEYEVQDSYLGRLLVKTRVVDVANPSVPRVISTIGTLLLPLSAFEPTRVRRRRVSFGVQRPGNLHDNDTT